MITAAALLFATFGLQPAVPDRTAAPLEKNTKPKNILLLVMDDVGVDSIGTYGLGSDLPSTPNIDALATQGVKFLNVWSNPVCSPTRASIQTGRYSFRTGIGYTVVNGQQGLAPTEVTLPRMLEIAGLKYSSAAFGKWHLGNDQNGGAFAPNAAGYDHYAGALVNIHPPETYYSWNKTVDGVTRPQLGYLTTDTVNDARDWINNQAQEPWLVQVAFHSAHTPFHAPPAYLHSVDLTGVGSPLDNPRPYFKAMVESMDTEIGRLLSEINVDWNDTVVICLGDNGTHKAVIVPPFVPSHGKGTAYQGGVHVPFIVAGAGVQQNGICRGLVNTTDLFATVADIAGADYSPLDPDTVPPATTGLPYAQNGSSMFLGPPPGTLDSVSLVPYFSNPFQPSLRTYAFTDMFLPTGPGAVPTIVKQAIRDKRYKVLFRTTPGGGSKTFFFDLAKDPFELTNLLDLPELNLEQQLAFNNLLSKATQLLSSQ